MTVFKSMFGFFLFICLCIYGKLLFVVTMRFMYCCLVAKSCPTLLSPTECQALLPMNFPGKNTGVSFHFLLQRIFPTQGLNPCLLHWRVDSLPLSHQGSPEVHIYQPMYITTYFDDSLSLNSF